MGFFTPATTFVWFVLFLFLCAIFSMLLLVRNGLKGAQSGDGVKKVSRYILLLMATVGLMVALIFTILVIDQRFPDLLRPPSASEQRSDRQLSTELARQRRLVARLETSQARMATEVGALEREIRGRVTGGGHISEQTHLFPSGQTGLAIGFASLFLGLYLIYGGSIGVVGRGKASA